MKVVEGILFLSFISIHCYSGPSILRPPMGRREGGLILQLVLKYRSFNTEYCPLGPNQVVL